MGTVSLEFPGAAEAEEHHGHGQQRPRSLTGRGLLAWSSWGRRQGGGGVMLGSGHAPDCS